MPVTLANVNYYLVGNYYFVGDNSTTKTDGISDKNFAGEITIQSRINGKKVIEISQYAFCWCSKISKVIILAKIRRINYCAFTYCTSLEYINIPETVEYIAHGVFCLNNGKCDSPSLPVFIEFNKGRTKDIFFEWPCKEHCKLML